MLEEPITTPLITNDCRGPAPAPAISMVTVFENRPGRPVGLKTTVTSPVSPGSMGVFVNEGVVQPHEARAALTVTASCPRFMNRNSHVTLPSSSLKAPKSWVVFSHSTLAAADSAIADRTDMVIKRVVFILPD